MHFLGEHWFHNLQNAWVCKERLVTRDLRPLKCNNLFVPKMSRRVYILGILSNPLPAIGEFCSLLLVFANSLEQDQARRNVGPDLDPNCLTL